MKDHGYKQSGIALLTTVILTGLLALLILSQMQLFLLDFKALSLAKEKHQAFWALEGAAKNLVTNSERFMRGSCLLAEHDPNGVIDLLINQKGCPLTHEKQIFYYLIEDLGVFPCLQTERSNQRYSTRHFRLSIVSAKKESLIIQERYASLAKWVSCENREIKEGKIGLLSWRALSKSAH